MGRILGLYPGSEIKAVQVRMGRSRVPITKSLCIVRGKPCGGLEGSLFVICFSMIVSSRSIFISKVVPAGPARALTTSSMDQPAVEF